MSFDDGRTEELGSTALIGRNPAGYDGEMISRLIPIQDSTRSVSKTHLHLSVSTEGLWVTDRHSTNGSAISTSNGAKTPLVGGTPPWLGLAPGYILATGLSWWKTYEFSGWQARRK
ncbi:hypothetical protein NHF46_04645 [Arthrobacter alpinus]|nr:hypothetical protein [Arthrobacter alpinus]